MKGETGEYVLTGTPAVPPRITDPERGNVTGEALIFNSGDDSVRVEGGRRKTRTETTCAEVSAEASQGNQMDTLIAEGIGKSYKGRQVLRGVDL